VAALELKIAYPLRDPGDDYWARLHRLASSAEPGVRREFLQAIKRMQENLDLAAIEAALERNDLNAVIRLVPFSELDDALAEAEAGLETVRSSAFLVGREQAMPFLHAEQLAIHLGSRGSIAIAWRHLSPTVLEAIRTNTATRVTRIAELTRRTISQFVERAFVRGDPHRAIATDIKQIIGLTPAQSDAVDRVRLAMVDEGTRPSVIAKRVERLRAKKVKQRAVTIARHESITAANDGQRASWRILAERGLLDSNAFEREWLAIVPTDGRTCPICKVLDGKRAPIDGDYEPADAKGGPPAHVVCRCTERLVPVSP